MTYSQIKRWTKYLENPNFIVDGGEEYTKEELAHFRAQMAAHIKELEKKHPRPWLGDPMSNQERQARANFALGKSVGAIPQDEPFVFNEEWKKWQGNR